MKIEDALKVLQENKSKHLYDIFIPSLQKNVSFEPLTVGQQKTLGKSSIENEILFYKMITALIQALAKEPIDLNDINEIDRILILANIKKHNNSEPTKYSITCPFCSGKFNHIYDIEDFIKFLPTTKQESIICEFEKFDIKYTLELNIPSVADMILFKDMIIEKKKAKAAAEKTNIELISEESVVEEFPKSYNIILFVKSLKINNENIDGFCKLDIQQRAKIIENMPIMLIDIVSTHIPKLSIEDKINLVYSIACPHCKKELNDSISIELFF